jgi:VanZ family protein
MSSRIKYYTFIPALIMAAGILVTSLLEADRMIATSLADKTLHIWAYGLLALTLLFPLVLPYKHHWRQYLLTWGVCCVYGAFIEMLQSCCTDTRVGEWLDIVANSIGTTIGLIIFFCIYYLWSRLHTNTK